MGKDRYYVSEGGEVCDELNDDIMDEVEIVHALNVKDRRLDPLSGIPDPAALVEAVKALDKTNEKLVEARRDGERIDFLACRAKFQEAMHHWHVQSGFRASIESVSTGDPMAAVLQAFREMIDAARGEG